MVKFKKAVRLLLARGPKAVYHRIKENHKERLRKKQVNYRLDKLHLISETERERQKGKVFSREERFSILTPLYNTPASYLHEMIQSLQKQTYGNWELCLANGSDEKHPEVDEICRQYMAIDSRIKYRLLPENRGISGNTNACLGMATGSYFGLLDHDDVLHESALYEMMCVIEETRADFLYTDEVKFVKDITKISDIMFFNFKPNFGKDELRSHNYICHFTMFSRALLEQEGGKYRSSFDGSQDHDMVLRLTEIAKRIVHIPKVLYYWRMHEDSVSMNLATKMYAIDAAAAAIAEQLKRQDEPGIVRSIGPHQAMYRIQYERQGNPLVSVIVYGSTKEEQLQESARRYRQQTRYQEIEIIKLVVDFAKTGAIDMINQAALDAKGQYLMFIHGETKPLTENWLEELLMYAQRKDVACVGGKVRYQAPYICFAGLAVDGESKTQVKCICRDIGVDYAGYEAMLTHVRNTTAVWLGCMMIEKEKFLRLGGLFSSMGKLADVDLALRGKEQGLWHVWLPFMEVEFFGADEDINYKVENPQSFTKRWQTELSKPDPFCHPVLKARNLV